MGAFVIIAGVCLGAQAGFVVGAVSAFVSNFFFGQAVDSVADAVLRRDRFSGGALFEKRSPAPGRVQVCVYGAVSTLFVYGGVMDPVSVLMFQGAPTRGMFAASYAAGFGYDLVHAVSTRGSSGCCIFRCAKNWCACAENTGFCEAAAARGRGKRIKIPPEK